MLPPRVHLFSITACFKYFSAIDCIVKSNVNVILLPFSAGMYCSFLSGIIDCAASFVVTIFPWSSA